MYRFWRVISSYVRPSTQTNTHTLYTYICIIDSIRLWVCECISWFCRECSSVGILFWWSQHSDASIHFVYQMEMVEISRNYKYNSQLYSRLVFHTFSPFVNKISFVFTSFLTPFPPFTSFLLSNLFCTIKRTKIEYSFIFAVFQTDLCTFNSSSISSANKQRFRQINDNFFCRQRKKDNRFFYRFDFLSITPHSFVLSLVQSQSRICTLFYQFRCYSKWLFLSQ